MSEAADAGNVGETWGPILDLFDQGVLLLAGPLVRHINPAAQVMLGDGEPPPENVPLRDLLEPGQRFDAAGAVGAGSVRLPLRGAAVSAEVRAVAGQPECFVVVLTALGSDSLAVKMADFADAAAEGVLIADAMGGINDPLASVLLSLEEAGDRVGVDSPREVEELAQLIIEARDSAKRVAEVVRTVLALPRVPAATVPVDINDMVERVVRSVARHRIALPVECTLGVCVPITVPEERLEQVLVHLLLTAPPREDGAPLQLTTEQAGQDVIIRVLGGGVGGDAARAFKRRYVVVTSLVQQMGGGCEASTGESEVKVVLRFGGASNRGAEMGASHRHRSSAPPRGELRILVVDDEPAIHRALKRALRDVGVVHSVGSGNGAIEVLEGGGKFDAVLCDIVMANGTGLDLANWLEVNEPRLKRRMILMSGMGEAESISHPDIVSVAKPFDSAALRELVVQVAGRA